MMAGLMLPAGRLIEILGQRPMLLFGLLVFGGASLACALSRDIFVLSGFRILQGCGAAVLYVAGPAIIRANLPKAAQGKAFALYTTAASAGMCLGPGIGGFVTFHLGWPWIFVINLPICAGGAFLLWKDSWSPRASLPAYYPTAQREAGDKPAAQREARDKPAASREARDKPAAQRETTKNPAALPADFDIPGSLLSFLAILGLVFGLNQGRELGWGSGPILASFLLAALAFGGFLGRELLAKLPALDLRLFLRPVFTLGNFGIFAFTLVIGGLLFLLPFYLEWFRGLTTDQAGFMFLIHPTVMILASVLAGSLVKAEKSRRLYFAGGITLALAMTLLALARETTSLWAIGLALAIFGLAFGLFLPNAQRHVMAAVPKAQSGMGAAVNAIIRVMGQLMGIVIFETVFSEFYALPSAADYASTASPEALALMAASFSVVFWLAAAIAIVTLSPCLLPGRSAAGSSDER
jgi:MFS family permease